MKNRSIYGINIDNLSFEEAVERIEDFLKGDRTNVIYTPNTEIIMQAKDDEGLKELINKGDMVTADGIGLIYAGRIKKKPIKERVTGYDLSMSMLNIADEKGYSLYLLGGKPGVAEIASENVKEKYKNIRLAGYHHGYFPGSHNGKPGSPEEMELIRHINEKNPDIIFVEIGRAHV